MSICVFLAAFYFAFVLSRMVQPPDPDQSKAPINQSQRLDPRAYIPADQCDWHQRATIYTLLDTIAELSQRARDITRPGVEPSPGEARLIREAFGTFNEITLVNINIRFGFVYDEAYVPLRRTARVGTSRIELRCDNRGTTCDDADYSLVKRTLNRITLCPNFFTRLDHLPSDEVHVSQLTYLFHTMSLCGSIWARSSSFRTRDGRLMPINSLQTGDSSGKERNVNRFGLLLNGLYLDGAREMAPTDTAHGLRIVTPRRS